MKFSTPNAPVFMGQPCLICLTDGTSMTGKMVYSDDSIVGLDNVSVLGGGGNNILGGSRALFPLAQIRWIMPEKDDQPAV